MLSRNGIPWIFSALALQAVVACGGGAAPTPPIAIGAVANPSSLSFGSVDVGSTRSLGVTIINPGSSSATVTALNVSGSGLATSGYTLPAALGPGQTGSFTASFTPPAAGAYGGQITIVSTIGSLAIAWGGSGATPSRALLTATPSSLSFGTVALGSTASLTVTVANGGSAAATVTQVTASGAGLATSGYSLPATLAPGQSAAFTASFTPQAAGGVSGQISIASDAPGSPLVVPVTGSGAQPPPPPPPPPAGQAFYVATTGSDANPGTSAAPWRTIGHAAQTLTAGQTALVQDGSYEEGQIDFAHSGASGSPITIRSQNPRGATLASTAGCNPAFSVSQSWIAIEGMVITASPSAVPCSAPSSAAAPVRCWSSNTPSPASPGTGFVGCTLRNNRVDRNPVFSVGFKTNQDYSLVENNVVYGSIEAFNNFGTVVRNNTVYDGDAWGSMVYGKGGVRSLQISGNTLHMTRAGSQGIFLGGSSAGWWWDAATHYEAYDSVAYDNVIVNEAGGSQEALGMYGAQSCALFNNVVVGGHLFFAPGSAPGLPPNPYPDRPSIQNNILDCALGGATSGWSYTGTLTLDYNDFFNCLSAPAQGHLPIGVDPLFVNPLSDWHLLPASPLLGAGTPLTFTGYEGEPIDVSADRDGVVRTVWSPGVY